jgi:heptosyltransferase-2
MPTQLPSPDRHPRRILIRGVNWLGDAVMTTPALLRLRERFPAAHIALLTPEKLRDLWFHHPAVNQVIPFAMGESLFSVSRKLRECNFDLALVLPNSPRSALEVWLARIPQRIGYVRPWRNLFLTQAVTLCPGHVRMHKRSVAEVRELVAADANLRANRACTSAAAAHQIHEYLHLAGTLGVNPEPLAPKLFLSGEELRDSRLSTRGVGKTEDYVGEQVWFGISPGAEYGPAKRWPVENFVLAANAVADKTSARWFILGGKGDREIGIQIARQVPSSINLAGHTTLRELMVALYFCRVLLTNDSGPMHLAAALGTPVVVPFGSTSPAFTGPGLLGDARHKLLKSDAPCSPCFRRHCPIDFRCMKGISVGSVVQAVMELWRSKPEFNPQ